MHAPAQLVPVVHRRDPRPRVATGTSLAARRAAVPATIEQYGGRYLARGRATELIEGGPEPKRIVILEFADTASPVTIRQNTRRSCRAGSITRRAAPLSWKAQASHLDRRRAEACAAGPKHARCS